jgi:hypothetical protein
MIDYLLMILVAYAGLFAHYLNRYYQKREALSFMAYMSVNPKSSIMSMLSVAGSASFIIAGADPYNWMTNPSVMGALFSIGYMADSVINRGSK